MSFTKLDSISYEDRTFLDREDILDNIEKNVLYYKENMDFYKLFSFYGMGGIGKSQLINQIYNKYYGTDLEIYRIPLEILNKETVPSILFFIRTMFSKTPHFDYVLFCYWDFYNFAKVNTEKAYRFIEKSISFIAEKVDNIFLKGSSSLPHIIRFIIETYESSIISKKQKESTQKLLQDKPENLYQYMTELLAQDIEAELNGRYFMFLFDAYHTNNQGLVFDWLKYFINSFHCGIFITTSRESLDWFNDRNIDKNMCENIPIDTIPPDIIKEYLLYKNFTLHQINIILEKTDCVPLFVDIALNLAKSNRLTEDTFIGFQNKSDLIKNFLSHFSKDERAIVEYLSVVRLFNQEIYENVLNYNKLSPHIYCFHSFKQSSIIRYVEEYNRAYKIHSILAQNITYLMDVNTRHTIIQNYIQFIHDRTINDTFIYDDAKYNFILNVYELIEDEGISVYEYISEQLLDMYFYLIEKSYNLDFEKYFNHFSQKKNGPLKYIYQYIHAKSLRMSDIEAGLNELKRIPIPECNFGKHTKSLECDINYSTAISGSYNEAEKRMKQFLKNLNQRDVGERYYIKGSIYYYDMQMLRGKFKQSVANLIELNNNDNGFMGAKLQYEIKKAIGHNYRFNFLIDKAMNVYSECGLENNKPYYYTVYCESKCYFEPEKVLDIYLDAVDENEKYGNHNNLGKIYYSMAIVQIIKKNYVSAHMYIQKAYNEFEQTHYVAGGLFVMIAEAYLSYGRDRKISSDILEKMLNRINELDGIYEYLLLPIYAAMKNHLKLKEYENRFEWFSYNETLKNIYRFIYQLEN